MKKNFNIQKSIFKIAVPIMIEGIVFQVQVLIDRYFLGNINSEYHSAIGNAIFPFDLFIAFIIGFSTGVTIIIAKKMGAGKYSEAAHTCETSILYTFLISLFSFFIWFFFSRYIFIGLGVKQPILEYSIRYVRFLAIVFILFGIETSLISTLQGIGITKFIMYAAIIKTLLNILLDWVLIFGKLGMPALDIEGAALATSISSIVSALFIIAVFIFYKKIPFQISPAKILKARLKEYYKIVKIGLPVGLEEIIWYSGSLFLLWIINSIDHNAAGIYTLILTIEVIAYMIYLSFGKAAITLIGQKIGARSYSNLKRIVFYCYQYALSICVFFGIIFILFPEQITAIFSHDPEMIRDTSFFMIFGALLMFPRATNCIFGYAIRGSGNTKWMLYSQIFGTVFIISLSYILVFIFEMKLAGVFIALICDEMIRGMINVIKFLMLTNSFKKHVYTKVCQAEDM